MSEEKQVCTKCNIEKSLDEFYLDRNGKVRRFCKICHNLDGLTKLKNKRNDEKLKNKKQCITCHQEKELNCFSFFDEQKSIYKRSCKECHGIQITQSKKCKYCGENKNISEFPLDSKNKNRVMCNYCFEKPWLQTGVKRCNKCLIEKPLTEFVKNRNKCKSCKYQYMKDKYSNNTNYKLRRLMSNLIRSCVSKNRNSSFLEYIGYTITDLKKHLESQFEDWMTWDNWGIYNSKTHDINPTWNIDHIIPMSHFNFTRIEDPEFLECFALSNLRPLDAKINISEGDRRDSYKRKMKK